MIGRPIDFSTEEANKKSVEIIVEGGKIPVYPITEGRNERSAVQPQFDAAKEAVLTKFDWTHVRQRVIAERLRARSKEERVGWLIFWAE